MRLRLLRKIKMAEKEGSNPRDRFLPVCTLSRGVPSATRPLLRTSIIAIRKAYSIDKVSFWQTSLETGLENYKCSHSPRYRTNFHCPGCSGNE